MTIRILTLCVPDGRQFYAACNACGYLSQPLPEQDLVEWSAARHACRSGQAPAATMTHAS